MKRSWLVPIVFFVFCIIFVIFGAITYALYFEAVALNSGTNSHLVFGDLFFRGLIVSMPYAIIIACLFMVFYLIKTGFSYFLAYLLYFLISLASWSVFLPFVYNIQKQTQNLFPVPKLERELSSGYFRNIDDGLYYYAENSVLFIDEQEDKNNSVYVNENDIVDPLIKPSLRISAFTKHMYNSFYKFYNLIKELITESLSSYFLVILLGFVFSLLIGFQFFTSWKLLNVFLVCFFFLTIIFFNVHIVFSDLLNPFQEYLIRKNFVFSQSKNFLPFVINGFLGLIFIVLGMIGLIRKKRRNSGNAYENF